MLWAKSPRTTGFTIVELIVVIAVIAILATISVVGYGAWREATLQNAIKSDLKSAASAMEGARNFGAGYPTSLPESFQPGNDVTIVWSSGDATSYCIDGSATGTSVTFYIDSLTAGSGPQAGTCATRTFTDPPIVPTNLAVGIASGTSVAMSWTGSGGATSYTSQCASDQAFIAGLQQSTGSPASALITGLTPSTTFYCRVRAVNSAGVSAWSPTVNTNTPEQYGSLPIAASLDGYWTTAPQGYLLEDGSAVSRAIYANLFAVIGTTYGSGDGSTTFNLPDSRGRATVNRNASDVEFATIGQKTGSKTEQLTTAQIPAHTHTMQNPRYTTGSHHHSSASNTIAEGPNPASGVANALMTSTVGSGQTHDNIQPSIVKLSAIKYVDANPTAPQLPAGSSVSGYWSSAPTGYLAEDGAAVSRTTYGDLFSVVGTTYGSGNGSTTFNVPDSRGYAGTNLNASDSTFDTLGEKSGEKTHILTLAELPSHQHVMASPRYTTNTTHTHSTTGTVAEGPNPAGGTADPIYTTSVGGDGAHNEIQPSITKLSVIKHSNATDMSTPVPSGTSISGYWPTTPTGYLYEDGSAVSRTTYAALFAVIGTTYGSGDGSTTFNLPDSRGRLAVNRSLTDVEFDVMGEKNGSKTVTLTIAQMPSHDHAIQNPRWSSSTSHTHSSGSNTAAEGPNPAGGVSDPIYTNFTGGGGAHNNLQPSIVKRFVIKY